LHLNNLTREEITLKATVISIDLGDNQMVALRERILQELKQRGLYRSDLLYRGFSHEMIDRVLEHGSENPTEHFVYANPEEYLSIDPDPRWLNPLSYARSYWALAVYRGDRLKEVCFTCYEFPDLEKKPEALIAVFSLTPSQ